MAPLFFMLALLAFGWAGMTYAAASMHPTPSQTNLVGQMLVAAGAAGFFVIIAIISLFTGV